MLSGGGKAVPPIVWASYYKPKKTGGLGVKNVLFWNIAAVIKHVWHTAMKKDSQWLRWIQNYHLKQATI